MAAVRRETAALALGLVTAGCGSAVLDGPVRPAPSTVTDVRVASPEAPAAEQAVGSGISAALDAIGAAFRAADPEALRPWLDDPGGAFGRRWLERAENLAAVPLASYRLELDPALPDLATPRLQRRYDGEVALVAVREEHRLEGHDPTGPASEHLYLTFVRSGGRWRVASDTDGEPLGLISVDHLWDHGPVVATRSGTLVALHHPGQPEVDAILAEARRALADAVARWPLAWPESVPLLIPRDEAELAELLHVTFDLSQFVAFATATPRVELTDYQLTGARVVVNTPRFLARSAATRRLILVHELTHVATRPVSGPFVPAWLEEGVAQALGEQRPTTGRRLLDALVAAGEEPQLPTQGQFLLGGRDRIFLSYQLAWSFVDHLADRYSPQEVARFYAEVGQGAVGRPGNGAWHLDRAARDVFGVPFDRLVAAWQRALRDRAG